jgi:hypothetical protein
LIGRDGYNKEEKKSVSLCVIMENEGTATGPTLGIGKSLADISVFAFN